MAVPLQDGGRPGVKVRHAGLMPLCRVDELAEPGSRGFRFGSGADRRAIFVVRQGGRIFGYKNSCPHTGSPLDWVPDRFLDRERRLILCATHGARFRIEDGYCLEGPCAGARLAPVALRVEAGAIYLVEEGRVAEA